MWLNEAPDFLCECLLTDCNPADFDLKEEEEEEEDPRNRGRAQPGWLLVVASLSLHGRLYVQTS